MGKARRTKKQKVAAKHSFTISWKPSGAKTANQLSGTKKTISKPTVKRQKNTRITPGSSRDIGTKYAKKSGKDGHIVLLKRDLVKSLSLASLILGIEIVIYFAWNL